MGDISEEILALQQQIKTWRQEQARARRSRLVGERAARDGYAATIACAEQAIAQATATWERLASQRYRAVTGMNAEARLPAANPADALSGRR